MAKHAACNKRTVWLRSSQRSISCPQDGEKLWDAHPKVYLSIAASGRVVCPYCGTCYRLLSDKDIEVT